jgi:hypothetical protein
MTSAQEYGVQGPAPHEVTGPIPVANNEERSRRDPANRGRKERRPPGRKPPTPDAEAAKTPPPTAPDDPHSVDTLA